MSQYWADLEQQEYDPDEFVERLAFRFGSCPHVATLGSEFTVAKALFATLTFTPFWNMLGLPRMSL